MTVNTPMPYDVVRKSIERMDLETVGLATIRELNRLVNYIEEDTGEKFIRMEMGIPGLKVPEIAIESECAALKRGVGGLYPPFDGIPELKKEISAFVKNFMDVEVSSASCFPTVGSMQGCYLAMMACCRRLKGKDKILFLDPGFPVNKRQAKVIGVPQDSFDVYNYRGEKLREKLESYLKVGDVGCLLYSNPNNPAWIAFTDEELQIIGELCTKYDVIALEDLAYFGMDFRKDYSQPRKEPFIPSVAKYTENYILIISSSKSFTLAGQRVGMTAISDKLFNSVGNNLEPYFGSNKFGYAYIFGGMYALSSGVSHSAQWGLCGLLQAVNKGEYNFVEAVKEYGERAKEMKKIFTDNGFEIVYDTDVDKPIADGFYFTLSYKGFTGVELVEELLYYGISAISLSITGSIKSEGLRACVSLTGAGRYNDLKDRVKRFNEDHKNGIRLIDGKF